MAKRKRKIDAMPPAIIALRDEFAMAALTGYAANARVMDKALDDWHENGGARPT